MITAQMILTNQEKTNINPKKSQASCVMIQLNSFLLYIISCYIFCYTSH